MSIQTTAANSPLISVVMSVYNGEKFLVEAIESIINQTYTDLEFIIINDASTDKTNSILENYGLLDRRVKIIKNVKNIGLTKSLNIGLRNAKGKYIARMDADDISLPNRIEKQVRLMEQDHSLALCGAFCKVIDKNKLLDFCTATDPEEIKVGFLFRTKLAHPSVMIRKKVIEEEKIYYNEDLSCAQDYDFFSRISLNNKVANISEVLLLYRELDGGVTKQKHKEQINNCNKISVFIAEHLIGRKTNELEKKNHIALRGYDYSLDLDLPDTVRWVNELYYGNEVNHIYQQNMLRKELLTRWLELALKLTKNPLLIFMHFNMLNFKKDFISHNLKYFVFLFSRFFKKVL